ncbi:MAG: hypothetical protein QME14_00610 [Methanobacteriaceae archaeon]|nr:hypothetical protein [Methanobacteriaceae archaeon]
MKDMDKMMEKMFKMCNHMEKMPFMDDVNDDKQMQKCYEMMKKSDFQPKMEKCYEMMKIGDFDPSKFFK